MLTREELDEIVAEMRLHFVDKDECKNNVKEEDTKIESIKADITAMKLEQVRQGTKQSVTIGILCAIAVPLITVCVKLLFGGI